MIENFVSTEEIPATCEAVLSIRLWAALPDAAPDDLIWEGGAPAAALAMDLIAASEGRSVTANGSTLVSHFSTIEAAIFAARRIQWAVAGFAEAGTPDSVQAAILIRSATDSSSSPQIAPLEQAAPGQILLAETTCRQLENLPGLHLLPSSQAGLRELQWGSAGGASQSAADAPTLAQLIDQHGLEDPDPPRAKETPIPARVTEQAQTIAPDQALLERTSGEHLMPLRPRQSQFEDVLSEQPRERKRTVLMWGIAAGCVVLVAGGIGLFALLHGRSSAGAAIQPGPSSVATQPTSPARPSGPGGSPSKTPPDAKKKDHGTKKQVASAGTDAHQPPPKPTSACLLNNYEIPSQLDNAAASFQNRLYQEAEKKFRSVLACDPKNARAISGAERAHNALLLQSPSTTP